MYRNYRIYFFLAISLVFVCTDSADALGRRSRRSNYSDSSGGGIKTIAPSVDSTSDGYRSLQAYYSYDKALEEEVAFTDRVRVYLLVRDEKVLDAPEPIVAEVKVTDLSNQAATRVRFCPVSFQSTSTDFRLGVFDVANEPGAEMVIEPAKVYRLFVNLHRSSDNYGPETSLGKMAMPYYVATSDDTRLGRARQHIAMRTFKEFYYAHNGWASEERYPMDCYAYYMWATGSCTVGAQNGRTILDRLFGGRRPFDNGGAIRNLAEKGAIHGDYVRMSGHSFMLLAYDPGAQHVWTMEGNFNSTIEIVIRSVDPGWTVGHLVEEHVNPQLFQVSRTAAVDVPIQPPL